MYEFCCPVRNSKYSRKRDRIFVARVQKYSGLDKTSLIYNHLLEWERFNYVVNFHSLPPSGNLVEYFVLVKIAVCDNRTIIDNSLNWIESLHIKWKKASTWYGRNQVNWSITAIKELILFSWSNWHFNCNISPWFYHF